MENIENKVPNGENQDTQNSSFFSENVSSSNGLESRLRFGGFSYKWEKTNLGTACNITMGQSPDSSSYNTQQEGFPLVQGNADMKDRISSPQRYTSKPTKICKKDSILLSVRAPVGTVGRANQDLCIGRGLCAIQSNCIEFVYQYLLKNENSWKSIEQGGTFTAINSDDIKNFPLYIPLKNECNKIADFLSLVDQRIEKQRQLVEALKKYKRGLLYLFFETKKPNKKLSELIKIGKAGGTPLSSNPNYYNGKIPFLSISDMTNQGKYLYSTDKYISDEGLSNSAAWLVPINSLIISMYASYGLVAINKIELSTSQAMFNIIPQEPNDIEFLYYYLSYLSFTGYYDKMVSTGTQPNLNAEKIKNIPIYIPLDKKEKEKISNMLLTFEDKEKQAQKILSNLEQLKNGLLQQMFI